MPADCSKLQSRSAVKRRNGQCVCADRRLPRIAVIESETFAVRTMIDRRLVGRYIPSVC